MKSILPFIILVNFCFKSLLFKFNTVCQVKRRIQKIYEGYEQSRKKGTSSNLFKKSTFKEKQRAAKAQNSEKPQPIKEEKPIEKVKPKKNKKEKSILPQKSLFSHLDSTSLENKLLLQNQISKKNNVHIEVIKLHSKIFSLDILGSTARLISLINIFKKVFYISNLL